MHTQRELTYVTNTERKIEMPEKAISAPLKLSLIEDRIRDVIRR